MGASPLFGALDVDADAAVSLVGAADDGARFVLSSVGGDLLVGLPEAGAVLRVPPLDGTLGAVQRWTAAGTGLGTVVIAGDVDGDGGWELIVGAPERGDGRGAVLVFRDAARDPAEADEADADVIFTGSAPGDAAGASIALCPGSGPLDLVVAAPRADGTDGAALGGKVWRIAGDVARTVTGIVALDDVASAMWTGDGVGAAAGAALLCTDLIGDGVADTVVGAPFAGLATDDAPDAGLVAVLDGTAPSGAISAVASARIDGAMSGAWLGEALAAIALPSGPALVTSAPGEDAGRGAVWVWDAVPFAMGTPKPRARFQAADLLPLHLGRGLAVGDVDADGVDDLVLGAPDLQVGRNGFDAGRAWVWSGALADTWSLDTPLDLAGLRVDGTQPFGRVGLGPHVADLRDDVEGAELWLPLRTSE
jgi:hypothetical protein